MRTVVKTSLAAASIALVVIMVAPTLALGAPNSHANAQSQDSTAQSTDTTGQAADHKEAAQTKLADAKLKACQNREKAINNILSRLADRSQKQNDLFTKIADRTEVFYKDKGKTLSNYDALVADVNTKKAAAQSQTDKIKDSSITFKCDGTDPKGALASFKESLKAEQVALKDFKTAVKNLIVGVKSAQGTTSSTDKNTTEGGQQ